MTIGDPQGDRAVASLTPGSLIFVSQLEADAQPSTAVCHRVRRSDGVKGAATRTCRPMPGRSA